MVTNIPNTNIARSAILQTEVMQSLNRSLNAFNKGLPEFFDEFAVDATIFMADTLKPIKGREAYRQLYEAALSKQGREKTILDRKIQIVGDRAVVTQKARITEGEMSAHVFQTLIYGLTSEGLKVQHSQTLVPTQRDDVKGATFAVNVIKEDIGVDVPIVGVAQ